MKETLLGEEIETFTPIEVEDDIFGEPDYVSYDEWADFLREVLAYEML